MRVLHCLCAVLVAGALLVQPADVEAQPEFCAWLDAVDTHYDVLASFAPSVAYDSLAYPQPLADAVSARLIAAGCDY
jgi:hypothetical protein